MSVTPWWASAVTVIVGAMLAFLGAWLNTNRALRHQREQERLKDAQNLRDKRFERLHAAYYALVDASLRIREDGASLEGDIRGWFAVNEQYNQKRLQEREQRMVQADAARITLMLEGDADDAWQLFDQISKAFDRYFDALIEHSLDKSDAEWNTIEDGTKRILDIARTRLGALQKAI